MTALAEDLPESEGNRMAGSRSVTWRSRRLFFQTQRPLVADCRPTSPCAC